MEKDIKEYVAGCTICQENKTITHRNIPDPAPITTEHHLPFQTVALDFITDLPESKGFDSCLVVTDHDCTKTSVFIPCNKTVNASETASLYQDHVFRRFGLPLKLISDRGPQFASKMFRELCTKLGIRQNISSAFHPQTDGQSERVNQDLELYLRIFCNHRATDWAEHLPLAEFAHNNRKHDSIRTSPFQALMGFSPRHIIPTIKDTDAPDIEQRLSDLKQLRQDLQDSIILSQKRVQERGKHSFQEYSIGQKVWLESMNLKGLHPKKKLGPKRYGPFTILQKLSPIVYKIKLPTQWKVHPVFHAGLLHPYKETEFHGPNYTEPPPDLIEGQEEYEIEKIVDMKRSRKRDLFRVRWKGYLASADSWLPRKELTHAQTVLDKFLQTKKTPRRI